MHFTKMILGPDVCVDDANGVLFELFVELARARTLSDDLVGTLVAHSTSRLTFGSDADSQEVTFSGDKSRGLLRLASGKCFVSPESGGGLGREAI